MKAEVKIPKGWTRVKTGAKCQDGDLIFEYDVWGDEPPRWVIAEVEDVDKYSEIVEKSEIVIRKIRGK